MQGYTVLGKFKAKKGQEAELERALRKVTPLTHEESGCTHFSLHKSLSDPAEIITFERWTSKAAHDQHLSETFIKELIARMPNLIEKGETFFYGHLPEGNSPKGKI
jgi:quinol monooxygenase YgiN